MIIESSNTFALCRILGSHFSIDCNPFSPLESESDPFYFHIARIILATSMACDHQYLTVSSPINRIILLSKNESDASAPLRIRNELFPKSPSQRLRSNYTTKHEIKHRANAQRPMRKAHERAIHPSIKVGHKHQKNLRLIN